MGKQFDAPVLLCGRYFNLQELLEIQATVQMFPKLSRHELTKTICENLDWLTPGGQYKIASCMQLLEKLEEQDLVSLPPKRKPRGRNRKRSALVHVRRLLRLSRGHLRTRSRLPWCR